MTCERKNSSFPNHLTDDQMKNMVESAVKDHVKIIQNIQKILYDGSICEADFITILINLNLRLSTEAIVHAVESGVMVKGRAIELIIGGILRNFDVNLKLIDGASLQSSATTH